MALNVHCCGMGGLGIRSFTFAAWTAVMPDRIGILNVKLLSDFEI